MFSAPPVTYVPPTRGAVLRHYEAPPTPYAAGHRGIDLACATGSIVVSSATGTVAFAGKIAGEWYVSIDHEDGIRSTYSYVKVVLVTKGQRVARTAPVARCGSGHPGSSLPTHMHFGMKRGDTYLDPEPMLIAGFRSDYSRLIHLADAASPARSQPPMKSTDRVPEPLRLAAAATIRFPRRQRRPAPTTIPRQQAAAPSPGLSRIPMLRRIRIRMARSSFASVAGRSDPDGSLRAR